MPQPSRDGDVLEYTPPQVRSGSPRVYFVNGIQTSAEAHAKTAEMMAMITERPVFGVYNASGGAGTVGGMGADLAQCAADWLSNTSAKVGEYGGLVISAPVNAARHLTHAVKGWFGSSEPPPETVNLLVDVNRLIPEGPRVRMVEARLGMYNRATRSLYQQLRANRGSTQWIIAHSQGNLITADALWAMVYSYGEASLSNMRVFSLASPVPAWPLGIRYKRKVYGFKNDLVTLADPHNWTVVTGWLAGGHFGRHAGDWRRYGATPVKQVVPGLDPHDLERNAYLLNFANSIRRDLGLNPVEVPANVK